MRGSTLFARIGVPALLGNEPAGALCEPSTSARLVSAMKQTFTCPVELALDVLGGKWRAVILARVKEGSQRYSDLRRCIPRTSEKMLTQRLQELVKTGLLAKRSGGYRLTARGERARAVLEALHTWGQTLVPELGVRIEQPGPHKRIS